MRVGIVATLAVVGVPLSPAGRVMARSPDTVVITEEDLAWPVSESGRMGWSGFGQEVSADDLCSNVGVGGPITAVRFELEFDLSSEPPELKGTLSGTMRAPGDEEWAGGSFSGPIAGGWARETDEGWAWGGNADLTLDFAGAATCATITDDSGVVVDRIVAEGNGQRQVTVEFAGGPGAWGAGEPGFRLSGSGGSSGYSSGQVGDGWSIDLGCDGCTIPLPLPISSGEITGGDQTVSSVPQQPAGGQTPTAEDEGDMPDVWTALFGNSDVGPERGWSPLGVAILILFLVLLGLAAGLVLKDAIAVALTTRVRSFAMLPTPGQTAAVAHDAHLGLSHQRTVTVESPTQPRCRPEPGAAPAGWMMQPGQPYTMSGGEASEQTGWVQVRQGVDTGWVHRSTVQDWQRGDIVRPLPPGTGAYRETVDFPQDFDTRNPVGNNYTRQSPGRYALGPPGPDGFRPVYQPDGSPIGSIPPDKIPPSSLTRGIAPPPPPPPPPP